MISDNDPFVRAVADRLEKGLLAICVNDEKMGGDSCKLTKGELYEISPTRGRGQRAHSVNSHGWQHSDHFKIVELVRCVNANGERGLKVGETYDVEGGYFYNQQAYVRLKGLKPEYEGYFALAWGGFRFDRFEVVEKGATA